jgi:hypothetical protein
MENTKPKNKYEAQRKYNLEVFNGLYPLIFQILSQLDLTEIRTEYIVNGVSFQIMQYGATVEMGLTSESQTEYSLSFSYSANKGIELLDYNVSKIFKQAIFDATNSYVGGKPKVSVMFGKELDLNERIEMHYESIIPNMVDKDESTCINFEIKNLINKKLDADWDKHQANTNKIFTGRVAELFVYNGKHGSFNKRPKQEIQITDENVFIMWRVDTVEYLMSIVDSLRNSKNIHLKIDLDEDDYFFAYENSMYTTGINKISIIFS